MLTEQDKRVWDAIVAESRRRIRRRRRLAALPAALAAVAVAAVAAGVLATRPDHHPSPTHVAAGPSPSSTLPSLTGDAIPSLLTRFALPPCPGATASLATWATDAVAPWTSVADAPPQPASLRDVAGVVPVLVAQPTLGSCATAIALGGAMAWEEHDSGGALMGRGVGVPTANRSVPSRLTAQRGLYHQDFVASGQTFNGVVGGGHVDGLAGPSAVVLDLPALATGVATHDDGLPVLAQLTFATVAPVAADLAFKLPTAAPSGFARCTADVAYLHQAHGTQVDYCNADGVTITVSWPDVGPNPDTPPPTSSFMDVNGVRAGVYSLAGSSLMLKIRSSDLWQAATLAVDLEGPGPVGLEPLAAMLRSIPMLDPRVLRPRTGTHDLRPLAMDNDRLRPALTAAGASDVTFPDCPPPAAAPPTTVRCGTGPVPSIKLTVPPGSPATLVTRILTDTERPDAPPLFRITSVETVAGVDVQVREASGTAVPRNSGQQAYFVCGRVSFNFIGNDVLAYVARLIPTLNC